jgi:hypothetical protein
MISIPARSIPNDSFSTPVTICVLCYGDFPSLAERVLESLLRHTPAEAMSLRIGLNAISAATSKVIDRLLPRLPVELVVRSEVNLYKLPMMRRLFYDIPLRTPWTIWFDDDSFVSRGDWLTMLGFESSLQPEVDMWGQKLFVRADQVHRQFIQNAPWYRGEELLPDDQPARYRLNFIAGGYWAIRTACLHHLNWPEDRLVQFGDDYVLGEAMRQNGFSLGGAFSGVVVNDSERRAPAKTPRCAVLN